MKELCKFSMEIFFEVHNAEIFGGAGCVGYTSLKQNGIDFDCLEEVINHPDQRDDFLLSQRKSTANFLSVDIEDVRIISESEYLEHTEEDGDSDDYFDDDEGWED